GATATSDTGGPAGGNNTGAASVPLNAPVAALAVTKTNNATSVVAGNPTVYTITVTNTGPSDASGVTVRDPLPAGVASASWTCTGTGGGCPAGGAGGVDTTGAVPGGGGGTFRLAATGGADAKGPAVNTG